MILSNQACRMLVNFSKSCFPSPKEWCVYPAFSPLQKRKQVGRLLDLFWVTHVRRGSEKKKKEEALEPSSDTCRLLGAPRKLLWTQYVLGDSRGKRPWARSPSIGQDKVQEDGGLVTDTSFGSKRIQVGEISLLSKINTHSRLTQKLNRDKEIIIN